MGITFKPPVVPAAFFGIVLGLGGLGNGWRIAHRLWDVPAFIGEDILASAAIVWAILILCFAGKWLWARQAALSEAAHPVQCCFIGLAGVATMLIAGAALPYSHITAEILFDVGMAFTVAFGVWRTGVLWKGERDATTTTPVLYLPTVAGSFVTAAVAAALGYADVAKLAFGAGMFSWLAIESVLLHRLYTAATLPLPLRPSLGIQLAPPTVGAVAYLSITSGPADMFAYALLGYGILQALLQLRLLPWVAQQAFVASYWAYSFGVTALGIAFLRITERGDTDAVAMLAPYVFGAVNIVIAILAIRTLWLLVHGRLLPVAAPAIIKA